MPKGDNLNKTIFVCLDCRKKVSVVNDVQGMTMIMTKNGSFPNKLCLGCKSKRLKSKNFGYPALNEKEYWWVQGYDEIPLTNKKMTQEHD